MHSAETKFVIGRLDVDHRSVLDNLVVRRCDQHFVVDLDANSVPHMMALVVRYTRFTNRLNGEIEQFPSRHPGLGLINRALLPSKHRLVVRDGFLAWFPHTEHPRNVVPIAVDHTADVEPDGLAVRQWDRCGLGLSGYGGTT